MSIEAMKQALAEIERVKKICLREVGIGICDELAIATLKAAIEEAEKQEPVMSVRTVGGGHIWLVARVLSCV